MNDITITGDLGSGKSSVAKVLCQLLDFEYYSTGKIQRELGLEKGMNTLELNYYSENNEEIDTLIDNKLIELNSSKYRHVFDSRMAWHFIKKSFKIYLTVHPLIAAKRVIEDFARTGEPNANTIEEKANNLIERRSVEDRRFKYKYGVDCSNLNNYDVIIDTSKTSINEIAKKLYNLYYSWLNNKPFSHIWASPLILFPTEHVRKLATDEAKSVKDSISKNGYFENSIVQVVKNDFFFFIWDGHKRVSGALFNKVPLIPIQILAKNDQEIHAGHTASKFAESALNLSLIYDWEDIHDFRFDIYPTTKVES